MKYRGKTLQEIQDLPLSEMHKHIKRWIDPDWNTYGTNKGTKQEVCTIEANQLAMWHIEENFTYDEYDITELETDE